METEEQHGLALSDDVFRRLADNVAEVLYSMTFVDSVCMNFVNSKVEELTGYAVEEILTANPVWMDIVHDADHQTLLAYAQDLVRVKFGEEHVVDLDWDNCLIVAYGSCNN